MADVQFEPMTVGGILDRTFGLYRQNLVRFITIVAVVQVPVYLLLFLCQLAMSSGDVALGFAGFLVVILFSLVGQNLSNAALLRSVSESYLGREVTVGQAYAAVLPKLAVIIFAAIAVAIVVGIGFILLIVPGLIFMAWYSVTIPAIVVEDAGVGSGMARSKALISGNTGKALGLVLIVGIIGFIVGQVFSYIGQAVAGGAPMAGPLGTMQLSAGRLAVNQLFALIGQIVVTPISASAMILLYYDMRIRKEGFDLEMLAQSMGAGAPPPDSGRGL